MIVFAAPDMCRASMSLGLSAVLGLAAIFAPGGSAIAQNLVQDGGFESSISDSSSPGWTLSFGDGTSFYDDQVQGGKYAHTGEWSAEFAAVSASQASSGTLSQTIAVRPATTYVVSFFLSNQGGPHDTFRATFDGQTVLSLTDAPAFGYTKYSAMITTTGKAKDAVLAFTGEQDSSAFFLDDVSVAPEGAPAPAVGAGLMSFAVVMIGAAVRRMRRHTLRRAALAGCLKLDGGLGVVPSR
jgi:hypothetical protein